VAKFNFIIKILKKLAIYLIKFYQRFLTFFLGSYNCRFAPSCSNYMIEAIEKKGLIKGIYKGFLRILKCHPLSKKSGFDPVE
jgi:putative membrane protein insertion efficiency factor